MADTAQPTTPTPEPADKSAFIRTMAKDMAQLSGQPAPAPAPKKLVESVVLPEAEGSFFEKPQPKETPQEIVDLPSMAEAGDIVEKPKEEDRQAILARLRKKVSESAQMDIETPPAPPANEWPDIPTPAPSFEEPKAEPPVERMPPVAKPVPEQQPEIQSPIHTFSSDFSKHIDQKGASTFSVLAAQQDHAATPAPQVLSAQPRGNRKAFVTIATAVVLLALAGGGVYGTYKFVMTAKETPIAILNVPSIVFADENKEVAGTGTDLMQAIADVAHGTLVPGNVLVTYVTAQ